MDNKKIKENADKILYEYGLLNELNKYGNTHIIGSYKMDLMVYNDLDIDIENTNINMSIIHNITRYVLDNFTPIWFSGRETIMANKKCYFLGFETNILEKTWNVDLWFFDKMEINKCVDYCNKISEKINKNPEFQDYIIKIKKELIHNGMYGSEFSSIDIYDAVLNYSIINVDGLIKNYQKKE